MRRYYDSSAFLSLYFDEEKGGKVHELLRSPGIRMTSELALVEVSSALRRGLGAKRITRRQHAELAAQAENHLKHVRLIPVSSDVIRRARMIADATNLKSLDAIHVASAKSTGAQAVVTFDAEMGEASKDFGMEVEN